MTVSLIRRWLFECNSHETTLILKALGGRLKPEDVEEAKKLGDSMTKQRAIQASALAEEMEHHASHVQTEEQ